MSLMAQKLNKRKKRISLKDKLKCMKKVNFFKENWDICGSEYNKKIQTANLVLIHFSKLDNQLSYF